MTLHKYENFSSSSGFGVCFWIMIQFRFFLICIHDLHQNETDPLYLSSPWILKQFWTSLSSEGLMCSGCALNFFISSSAQSCIFCTKNIHKNFENINQLSQRELIIEVSCKMACIESQPNLLCSFDYSYNGPYKRYPCPPPIYFDKIKLNLCQLLLYSIQYSRLRVVFSFLFLTLTSS